MMNTMQNLERFYTCIILIQKINNHNTMYVYMYIALSITLGFEWLLVGPTSLNPPTILLNSTLETSPSGGGLASEETKKRQRQRKEISHNHDHFSLPGLLSS